MTSLDLRHHRGAPVVTYTWTLIDTSWVLTAKHCITGTGATLRNSGVLVGDRHLGQGEPHVPDSFYLNPSTDSALIKLEDPVSQPNVVIGYEGFGVPAVGQNVSIRGWGNTPSPVLQVATMRTVDTHWPMATQGNRLLSTDIGQGFLEPGDSGAGVYAGGRINAVVSTIYNNNVSAVPTEDIATWIQQTSGVAPSSEPAAGGGSEPTVPFQAPVPAVPDGSSSSSSSCVNPLNPSGAPPPDDPQNGPAEPGNGAPPAGPGAGVGAAGG